MVDMVNHPPHYTRGGVECIDALASATAGLEGLDAVCTANAIKYLWRWKQKGGVEDLRKAQWYISKLIETSVTLQLDLLRPAAPIHGQTWATWAASEDREDDCLGTC
jgi:hypothetical protein